jgi:hypothetical protein
MFLPQPCPEDYPKEVLRNGTPLEPSTIAFQAIRNQQQDNMQKQ